MANPPPYDIITGISRAVMKDNAQETLAGYDGNARPGELVVNLAVDPPTVFVGNNAGELTQLSTGGTYGNANVVTLLADFGSNTIDTTGIVAVGSVTLINNARIKDTSGDAVAFGVNAGLTSQGNFSVAMGYLAGTDTQGTRAVAIGHFAGETSQRADAVAIGSQAGETSQGVAAVAIGALAGETAQGNNSIIINATSAALNQTTPNTFTVAPVRNDTSNIAEVLFYNTTSKEVTYSNTINVSGNISAGQFIGDGGGISNVAGANVSGTVALATTSDDISPALFTKFPPCFSAFNLVLSAKSLTESMTSLSSCFPFSLVIK